MPNADPDLARLRWRCRRGMRELDALLAGWLDTHYSIADDQTRQWFEQVVEMQDPDIMQLINAASNHTNDSHSSKDSGFENLIEQIRSFLPA